MFSEAFSCSVDPERGLGPVGDLRLHNKVTENMDSGTRLLEVNPSSLGV